MRHAVYFPRAGATYVVDGDSSSPDDATVRAALRDARRELWQPGGYVAYVSDGRILYHVELVVSSRGGDGRIYDSKVGLGPIPVKAAATLIAAMIGEAQ